jgi:hypothetical protein
VLVVFATYFGTSTFLIAHGIIKEIHSDKISQSLSQFCDKIFVLSIEYFFAIASILSHFLT